MIVGYFMSLDLKTPSSSSFLSLLERLPNCVESCLKFQASPFRTASTKLKQACIHTRDTKPCILTAALISSHWATSSLCGLARYFLNMSSELRSCLTASIISFDSRFSGNSSWRPQSEMTTVQCGGAPASTFGFRFVNSSLNFPSGSSNPCRSLTLKRAVRVSIWSFRRNYHYRIS